MQSAGDSERAGAIDTDSETQPSDGVRVRFPLGHFYDPHPDTRELEREPRRSQVWPAVPRDVPGICWRDGAQLEICREVFAHQQRLEFPRMATGDPHEYYGENGVYPPLDAWILEAMLRHLRPRRIIEVGSGHSTLVSARVNQTFFGGEIRLTAIEPHPPEFLDGLPGLSELRVEQVQDTPLEIFVGLQDGDVLFIDTSHTVKTGGDVAWLFGQVVPRLAPGVAVHVHDIFLPEDYPQQWVLDGFGWNELYLIQAFLAFNAAFEVSFGAMWMGLHHREALLDAFPCWGDYGYGAGGSLWIRRVAT